MKFSLFALAATAATAVSAGRIGKATFFWQNGNYGYCGAVNPVRPSPQSFHFHFHLFLFKYNNGAIG
jgi:hypothetical protein